MKKTLLLLALLLALLAPPRARSQEVNLDFFYDSLTPYGYWADVGDLGLVWQPLKVPVNWRPYTVGGWAYTDAGWTWISDEPFGAIVYHYGRWALVNIGWVWVPGTEWGPAWVSFRSSDKFTGWAPLPPEAREVREHGIAAWADSYYDLGPELYTFVETKHFAAPLVSAVVLPQIQTTGIIRQTWNVTNISYHNNVVFVGGPKIEVVTKQAVEPVRQLHIERRNDVTFERGAKAETFRSQVQGNSLRVFAPAVAATASAPPAKVAPHVEVQRTNGWGHMKEADALRAQYRKESPQPAGLPARPAKFTPLAKAPAATGGAATPAAVPAEAKEHKPAAPAVVPGTPAAPPVTERPAVPGSAPIPGKEKMKPFATPAAAIEKPATPSENLPPGSTPAGKKKKKDKGEPLPPGATVPGAAVPGAGLPEGTQPKMKKGEGEVAREPGVPKLPAAQPGFAKPAGSPAAPGATPEGKKKKKKGEADEKPQPAAQ